MKNSKDQAGFVDFNQAGLFHHALVGVAPEGSSSLHAWLAIKMNTGFNAVAAVAAVAAPISALLGRVPGQF